jgi:hypothetical protein
MTTPRQCPECADERRLVRNGTSQDQRSAPALDPGSAPVDEHGPAHRIVFARAYSALLRYVDATDTPAGTWQPFFERDVSAQLAVAAVADVTEYRATVTGLRDALSGSGPDAELVRSLGALFSAVGSLAARLDALKEALPPDQPLRAAMANLVRTQLAPSMDRLIGYYKAGTAGGLVADVIPTPNVRVLGRLMTTFSSVLATGLSRDWFAHSGAPTWQDHRDGVAADAQPFGADPSVAGRINHLATHNLFTSVLDGFLGAFARVVTGAEAAVADTFARTGHEPHYALFLAFVRLLEHARAEANTLTQRHLDFYYREILRLRERPAAPGSVHLLVDPAKQVDAALVAEGTRFRAGKDARGIDAFYAADRDVVANRARVAQRRKVYRHSEPPAGPLPVHDGRIFASAAADSDATAEGDPPGADSSWHPFADATTTGGALAAIRMPPAEVGFAIASHYLWLAEGARTVTVDLTVVGAGFPPDLRADLSCLLTTEEGWLERSPATAERGKDGRLRLEIVLTGGDPPITPYVAATHGYSFGTDLPLLVVLLRHRSDAPWRYQDLQGVGVTRIDVGVEVTGLRTLALSNDFGPVDASKPFQPYGPAPVQSSALVVGSKEAFQKQLSSAGVVVEWMTTPVPYETSPAVLADPLVAGQWERSTTPLGSATATSYDLAESAGRTAVDAPDLNADEPYGTSSRHGFVRLRLDSGFGQDRYADDLVANIVKKVDPPAPSPKVVVPTARRLTLDYSATQTISLAPAVEASGGVPGRFFHVTPFGHAEQRPATTGSQSVPLLPPFTTDDGSPAEAELCIGVSGLRPPQSLTLLAQVVDGTADPLAAKPADHVQWSYLRDNRWVGFRRDAVDDRTDGLLESGVVTLAVPADASDDNTLLPGGLHWVRAVVGSASGAVCRLLRLDAQALRATYAPQPANDPGYPATVLRPGTITKLDRPDPAVKTVAQPFAGFGGRGAESSTAFATRVSERLRHKDRGIALWDYERLVLEAFPSIYRVRCLNHTRFEPNEAGTGIYRELAAGHVTVVTIPVQQPGDRRDPLRPLTSLGLLSRIEAFLRARLPCFVTLHVRNPQFEEVHVDFRVRLREGRDETFSVNRLREAITRHLSPWAFAGGGSPTFTGRFEKSALIDFLEEDPDVDYVTDFRLFHHFRAPGPAGTLVETVGPDAEEVVGSRAVSVLVSVPAAEHVITVLHAEDDAVAAEACPCEVRAT